MCEALFWTLWGEAIPKGVIVLALKNVRSGGMAFTVLGSRPLSQQFLTMNKSISKFPLKALGFLLCGMETDSCLGIWWTFCSDVAWHRVSVKWLLVIVTCISCEDDVQLHLVERGDSNIMTVDYRIIDGMALFIHKMPEAQESCSYYCLTGSKSFTY